MSEIKIHIDQSDVERKLKKLINIKNGTTKVMMRALNRTVAGMKTDSWEQAKQHYTIKKKKDYDDKLAIEKATSGDLSVALRSRGRPMRSVKFTHRKNRASSSSKSEYLGRSFRRKERSKERGKDRGPRKYGSGGWNIGKKSVFLHVLKGSSGNHVPGAFMANFSPGKDPSAADTSLSGIFVRKRGIKKVVEKGNYKGLLREPMRQLYSPGSVQMLKNKKVKDILKKNTEKRFSKELDHEIEYLLNKQKG